MRKHTEVSSRLPGSPERSSTLFLETTADFHRGRRDHFRFTSTSPGGHVEAPPPLRHRGTSLSSKRAGQTERLSLPSPLLSIPFFMPPLPRRLSLRLCVRHEGSWALTCELESAAVALHWQQRDRQPVCCCQSGARLLARLGMKSGDPPWSVPHFPFFLLYSFISG